MWYGRLGGRGGLLLLLPLTGQYRPKDHLSIYLSIALEGRKEGRQAGEDSYVVAIVIAIAIAAGTRTRLVVMNLDCRLVWYLSLLPRK